MKIDIKRAALTGGIIWAMGMFVTTLMGIYAGYGADFTRVMASIYPGYSVTMMGAIIGAIWGFLDVYVFIYIFAWVYQKLGK